MTEEVIFHGRIRKANDAATLWSITDTSGELQFQTGWYRPETEAIRRDLRRFAAGDAVIVRLRDDKILKVTESLQDKYRKEDAARVLSTPTAQDSLKEANIRHTRQRALQQQAAGEKRDSRPDYSNDRKCAECGVLLHKTTNTPSGLCPPCDQKADAQARLAALSQQQAQEDVNAARFAGKRAKIHGKKSKTSRKA